MSVSFRADFPQPSALQMCGIVILAILASIANDQNFICCIKVHPTGKDQSGVLKPELVINIADADATLTSVASPN